MRGFGVRSRLMLSVSLCLSAPVKDRPVGTGGDFDTNLGWLRQGLVVLGKPLPYLGGPDAHDRVLARLVVRRPREDLAADDPLPQQGSLVRQGVLHDVAQETLTLQRIPEGSTGQDLVQSLVNFFKRSSCGPVILVRGVSTLMRFDSTLH